jgi:hypothetical protein
MEEIAKAPRGPKWFQIYLDVDDLIASLDRQFLVSAVYVWCVPGVEAAIAK